MSVAIMITEMTSVQWPKTLSLDRGTARPVFQHFLDGNEDHKRVAEVLCDPGKKLSSSEANKSFLYTERLKRNLEDSRKAFKDFCSTTENEPVNKVTPVETTERKPPCKRISFKIKKTASLYRKNQTRMNSVAELTDKFNQLNNRQREQVKVPHLVKRVNSLRNEEGVRVFRKPSVKMKPIFRTEDKFYYVKKPVTRRTSVKKPSKNSETPERFSVRAKLYLEPAPNKTIKENVAQNSNDDNKLAESMGTVRAAINLFENRTKVVVETSQSTIAKVPKPKIPEKSIALKKLNNKTSTTKSRTEMNSLNFNSANSNLLNNEMDSSSHAITKSVKLELETVEVVNLPLLPPKRCDSNYESQKRISPPPKTLEIPVMDNSNNKKTEGSSISPDMKPNSSFLWRRNSQDRSPLSGTLKEYSQAHTLVPAISENTLNDWEMLYDKVDPVDVSQKPAIPTVCVTQPSPPTPPPKIFKRKMPLPEEKIYEEVLGGVLKDNNPDGYEECGSSPNYEDVEQKTDDGYEYCRNPDEENIYETLPLRKAPPPPLLPRRQEEPLPPRPPSRTSYSSFPNGENISNCYESIYNKNSTEDEGTYESIYGCQIKSNWGSASNRDSIVSSEHQSNSLYGRSITSWAEEVFNTYSGKATSDLSSSDRSDDWVDITDNEEEKKIQSFVIVRERQKVSKKASGWSQHLRERRTKKYMTEGVDSDDEHHYESLNAGHSDSHDDDFDSFDSDSDSDVSFTKHDSGVDMRNSQLPEPPNQQTYVLTRLAASAGKHMKRLRRNWSLTKNDITKSLSRMTKKKSRTDLTTIEPSNSENTPPPLPSKDKRPSIQIVGPVEKQTEARPYQNMEFKESMQELDVGDKTKSLPRKGFLNKFRRSMSMSTDSANELTQNLNKPKSTFYLTDTIEIDDSNNLDRNKENLSPITTNYKHITRPQSPPPPTPNNSIDKTNNNLKSKRSTSWYAECGLFKNSEVVTQSTTKRPSSYWYAEVGLYQTNTSTPSTSSAENSGNTTNLNISDNFSEEYYNMKNQTNDYYNRSMDSFNDDSKIDMHLKLQDEPLYQFYDAAVHEIECKDGTELDSDGYEEVGDKRNSIASTNRPSAMELVAPNKSMSHSRTLWCEIPEVIQSCVLNTFSISQKKIQEAKFEMLTSEASYLNSLQVLTDHFIAKLTTCEFLTFEEKNLLFARVPEVKQCSEMLLRDLEQSWQDSIMLNGICNIIKTHAENNFGVYVSYCENQILIDSTLKKIKERAAFNDVLRQLELSSTCQSLTLYSFLMLPMQRITRWPLLVDAVLKRLSPDDDEYTVCQYALAVLNKTVTQCNEAARRMERRVEMEKIAHQLEFSKGMTPLEIASSCRWLVRSGPLTLMQNRGEDVKLTFGKRFTKVPLYLFLFNDLLVITKSKSEDNYTVLHYCPRNLVEMNPDAFTYLPPKDLQGRHLLFLTILENQDERTVEFLLSCNSESDKERWVEALSPPKSENPDEILYECWDCPQVTAIHNYNANQPDELALCRGDVINVTRKMPDGWYLGERIRDGQSGWFPSNYVVEIANPHVRARNLKQRYRLLAFSENYLKTK